MQAQCFMKIKKVIIKKLFHGKKIVQFFFQEKKRKLGTHMKEMESDRIALIYNLMTNNIRDVYKVEKKNYFLGNFRYKINPYLFEYFKTNN